jgi:hypothetical protein
MFAVGRGLIGGAAGLVANFILLGLADYLNIVTARGGFQRLTKIWLARPLVSSGVAATWSRLGLPDPSSALFVNSFKIGVGLVFALVYVAIRPYLLGGPIVKGLVYAALVWLVNAALVLPLLGEGFAGINSLTWLGILAFAVAHTALFLVLALIVQ